MMERYINMILRMFVRRAVNKGMDAGIRAVGRKMAAPEPNDHSPAVSEAARRKQDQQAVRQARRARKAVRSARRIGRM